jgi:hypothetical protein
MYTAIFSGNEIKQVQSGVNAVFNPGGRVRKLEEQLRFCDTFKNRVELADAYLAQGETEKAISLYEGSLTGAFSENEYVLTQLTTAYFQTQRFGDVIRINKKICGLPAYPRSKAQLLYAISLERTGNDEMAEKEFKSLKVRFANFESRHQYGLFLVRAKRQGEAKQIFSEMIDEYAQLSSREKRSFRTWIIQAKEELKKLDLQPA